MTNEEYTPAKGVAHVRRAAFDNKSNRGLHVRDMLRKLRLAQSKGDGATANATYDRLADMMPTHDDHGRVLYSRVDATVVSRIVPSLPGLA